MGRTEKSIKNIIFGFAAQIVTVIIGFFSKTLILDTLGIEYVSLNGLFHEVVAVLSLAELGMGSVIVYNLYKPLAENNQEKVSQIMTFYKRAYHIIAAVIMSAGVLVSIFIPLIVHDLSFSTGYERLVFILVAAGTASSYLFSYKITIVNADQKEYIYSFWSTIFSVFSFLVKVAVLYYFKNFVIYLCVCIGLNLIVNYSITKRVEKHYPYLHTAQLPKEDKNTIFDNIKNIVIKQISGKITSSTDNMIISAMVSTIMVGKYSFYATITGMIMAFTEKIESGVKSGLGNLFATGSTEDCERTIYRLTWLHNCLALFFCTCFFISCQSFITAWVGAENLLELNVVTIVAVNLFCYIVCKPIYAAMSVSGFFVEGRNISIIASVANLIVSVIFAYYTGIFGVFLGTFVTYFLQIVFKIHVVYKKKFKKPELGYHLYMLKDAVLFGILAFVGNYIGNYIDTSMPVVDFLIKGLIGAVLSLGTILIVYHKSPYYVYFKDLAFGLIRKKSRKG